LFFIDYLSFVLRLLEAAIGFFEAGGRLQMAEQWEEGCRWLNSGRKRRIHDGVMIFVFFFQEQTRKERIVPA
jgi:hypothetical protein